jgi:hypothetical protein
MMMRILTLKEQQLISGGGDGNNGGDKETYRGIGYGAQANGFQPNLAAKGCGLFQDLSNHCVLAIASGAIGIAGAFASRNSVGIATAMGSAAIGIGGTCNNSSGRDRGVPFR